MHIESIIQRLQHEVAQLAFGDTPDELYAPMRYLMQLGGKRLRPLLAILGGYLFTDEIEPLYKPSIGVEVFHNFTLMHDDIMDCAPLRRGNPTVHERWNTNVAILSGDTMLVKAYELLMQVPDHQLRRVLEAFNRCAREVCEGQQWDMNFEQVSSVSEGEYLEMIRLKTAVLLGFSLELGGIVGGANPAQAQALREMGQAIGVGFQLKDDLLDVFGAADKVGKQVGGDIIANKKTFLLIKALELANPSQLHLLQDWLQRKDFDKAEKVRAITELYEQLDIRARTEAKIEEYFRSGFAQLGALEVPAHKRTLLREYIEYLRGREH